MEEFTLKGVAHITGGGLIENVPRILPDGLGVTVEKSSVQVPEMMKELQKRGQIPEEEMFGTFNMGVGMVLIVRENDAQNVLSRLNSLGEKACIIGKVEKNSEKIALI